MGKGAENIGFELMENPTSNRQLNQPQRQLNQPQRQLNPQLSQLRNQSQPGQQQPSVTSLKPQIGVEEGNDINATTAGANKPFNYIAFSQMLYGEKNKVKLFLC